MVSRSDSKVDEMVSRSDSKVETLESEKFNELFKAAMEKNWCKVIQLYKDRDAHKAHKAKLTKAEQTALHIAIACYDETSKDGAKQLDYIKKMVDSIPKETKVEVLSSKDVKGNTPLHLAATLGNVDLCKHIAAGEGCWKLIKERNNETETPLFMAAHHDKREVFFQLRKMYMEHKEDEEFESFMSLYRGKDGNTVLHSAISGEYFKFAFQIINLYPKLVDSVNVDGEAPLHVLARQPKSFESSSHLRQYDYLFYKCIYVAKLTKEDYYDCATNKKSSVKKDKISYPGNYETFVGLLQLVGHIIRRFFACLIRYKEEDQHNNENKPKDNSSKDCRGEKKDDEENQLIKEKEVEGVTYDQYPENYATFIRSFQLVMLFMMIIIGVGYSKIKKIRDKKEKHTWAIQIMNAMIEVDDSSYKYYFTGQDPTQNLPMNREYFKPPDAPPSEDESEMSSTMDTYSAAKNPSSIEEQKVENGSAANKKQNQKSEKFLIGLQEVTKDLKTEKIVAQLTIEKEQRNVVKRRETPILIAAKTGITEMVKRIKKKIPIAIQDVDENDKNVLLIAIEYRQTRLFDYLMGQNLPESVIRQVDKDGNSARHLSGMYRPYNPWRLPGSALQMHGEVTWYKYVKRSLPQLRFTRYNKNNETPRDIFNATHEDLSKAGADWLIKTSESCSLIAALNATVAFATSATVPGGVNDESGDPLLVNNPLFNVFSIASLVALCFSLTSLVFFLAIITSRCQVWDFKKNLPRKLLMGLSSLFTSIAAILVTFCAGHFFVLRQNLKYAALPIYAITSVPLTIFASAQLPLYFDLMRAVIAQVPVRNFKVLYR